MVVKNKYRFANRYYATVDGIEVASDEQISDEEFETLRPTDTDNNLPDDAKYMTLAFMAAGGVLTSLNDNKPLTGKTLADVMFKPVDKKVMIWQ